MTRKPPRQARALLDFPDVYASGMFPVCPATHDLGIRRLFDLGTLLLLLDCRPGDTVLDLGAGHGFASEMLARLGYHVVAFDLDRDALRHNRHRHTFDTTRIAGSVTVIQGVAEILPFKSSSFDGLIGMNVLHHLPDLSVTVAELRRVLKPACRAVFSEPGLDHLQSAETQKAVREYGENDRPFDALEFLRLAKVAGFKDAMLSATLHSATRLLPLEEIDLFLTGHHPRPQLTAQGTLDVLMRHQPYIMLQQTGERSKTPRHPGTLKAALHAQLLSSTVRRGDSLSITVMAHNIGDTVWTHTPSAMGGFITLGLRLLTPEGRLISDTLGRTLLPEDVPPAASVTITTTGQLPVSLTPGQYALQVDLVNEQICWFADVDGNSRTEFILSVVE
jgi:SAM-dependent methyltransferase